MLVIKSTWPPFWNIQNALSIKLQINRTTNNQFSHHKLPQILLMNNKTAHSLVPTSWADNKILYSRHQKTSNVFQETDSNRQFTRYYQNNQETSKTLKRSKELETPETVGKYHITVKIKYDPATYISTYYLLKTMLLRVYVCSYL